MGLRTQFMNNFVFPTWACAAGFNTNNVFCSKERKLIPQDIVRASERCTNNYSALGMKRRGKHPSRKISRSYRLRSRNLLRRARPSLHKLQHKSPTFIQYLFYIFTVIHTTARLLIRIITVTQNKFNGGCLKTTKEM